ncbi:MAG: hypothetical protein H0V66_08465 [Bdellovibrionales bacterium]|nr:hypothetical protein [Bdellovibrionales bacterium]
MKYVVILVVVIILVRIDDVLRMFDKTSAKYQTSSDEVAPENAPTSSDLVSGDPDLTLKVSPRKTFLSMLNDFRNSPDVNVKERAIEVLRSQPTMFTETLDVELETTIYRWRDLLVQRNKVAHDFLMEIMKSLKGENLEMVRRFFSLAIDIDQAEFLTVYSKSTDINCLVMGYLGDNLPIEERYNELNERLLSLEAFLTTEKAVPVKVYGQRCLMVLKLQVDKLKAVVVPSEDEASFQPTEAAPAAAPEASGETAPIAAPTPSTDPGSTP